MRASTSRATARFDRVAIDTGGTFTDFVRVRRGAIEVFKTLSTPAAPERAVLAGLDVLRGTPREVIHGSTVATNALLERKGARTALITTAGFEDVLEIGRQTRRDLYDIFTTRPAPLVPASLRVGVRQRTLADGTPERRPSAGEIRAIVARLRRERVEAVAVSFLFAFRDPADEEAVGAALAALEVPLSLSSKVLPEYREFERTSTTVINAYLAPVMRGYLGRLDARLSRGRLRVMQSNGGAVRARAAMGAPVRTLLSGPAGGVVGASAVARRAGFSRLITFDMGGTSTDVALVDREIRVTRETEIDGMPVGVPMMDIHTVGAGGGSIVRLDSGGALRVGPESAGADPGPICYGRGVEFTITDANVLLGRLRPRFFLGGRMTIQPERIAEVLGRMKWTAAWPETEQLADGVIDVVNNNMEQAIRLISVERGYDPRDFTLVSFGGAGGLHAAMLAAGLGIPRVLVPRHPGVLSALGLLLADARKEYSETLLAPASEAGRVPAVLARLHRRGIAELRAEGCRRAEIQAADFVDVRYRGQAYELTVPFGRSWRTAFHRAHERRYGHSNPAAELEIVNVRCTMIGRTPKPALPRPARRRTKPEPVEDARAWFAGLRIPTPVYEREGLAPGHRLSGPAIIGEYSATTLVPPGFECLVDGYGNLILSREAEGTAQP